jgi:diketogulonate reductase-like aldo/keto reductase
MMPSNQGPVPRRRFLAGLTAMALAPAWRGLLAGTDVRPLYRAIPASGERLPLVGLAADHDFQQGLAGDQRDQLGRVLRLTFDLPRCLVDTSPQYARAESLVARIARRGGPGEGLFVATQVSARGFGEDVRQLQRQEHSFGPGRIDLVQIHNLVEWQSNLRTLREWKEEGRIRYIGVSHYHRAAFSGLERVLERERVDFLQLNYSLAEPEAEERLLPLAVERGAAVIASRPFAAGYLFHRLRNRPLPRWAAELGCHSWRCLLLKYVVSHPAVTCAVTDTADPAQMAEHFAAGQEPLLNVKQRRRLRAMLQDLT